MHSTTKTFSKIGFIFSALMIIINLSNLLLGYFISNFFPSAWNYSNLIFILSSLPLYLISPPFLLYFLGKIPTTQNPLIKIRLKNSEIFQLFCMSYSLMFVSNLIGLSFTEFIASLKGTAVENPVLTIVDGISPILIFITTVIIAPIFEEIFFRKLIIDKIIDYGEGISIFISGLIFGLFHANFNQFIYAFSLGMFFAYIYIKSGNIKLCILLHAVVNFMGTMIAILSEQLLDYFNRISSDSSLNFIQLSISALIILLQLFIFAIIFLGIVFWIKNLKKMRLRPRPEQIDSESSVKYVFLNFGMFSFIAITLVIITWQLLS